MYPMLEQRSYTQLYVYRIQSFSDTTLPQTSFSLTVTQCWSLLKKSIRQGLLKCIPLLPGGEECYQFTFRALLQAFSKDYILC
jgi:hypothetical protein